MAAVGKTLTYLVGRRDLNPGHPAPQARNISHLQTSLTENERLDYMRFGRQMDAKGRAEADLAASIHGTEHRAVGDPGGRSPHINRDLDPRWYGNRPNSPMLADEIHDAPAAIPLPDVLEGKRRYFGAPQPASKEHCEDGPVTQPFVCGGIRCVQERLRLLRGQPVPMAHALGSHAFHAGDAVGQLGLQQAVIGGLYGQLANRRDPHVDGNGP